MDACIRSRLTSGLAVVGVSALIVAPVASQAPTAPSVAPIATPHVALTAHVQPLTALHPLAQPTTLALFAREIAIPGALLDDIHNGTPAPVALSRALQTFAQIELEAGRELVGFAAEYVSFPLNFFANLATMPVVAVNALAR
jgi:hypothetical protein